MVDFSAAARSSDLAEMGKLFVASHRSMQHDYEISCEEIDFLVDTAIEIPGVYGAQNDWRRFWRLHGEPGCAGSGG